MRALLQVSKYFNSVAGDNMLWHRLYKFRWSENDLGSKHFNESVHLVQWKQLYIDKEREVILYFCNGDDDSAENPVLRSFKDVRAISVILILSCKRRQRKPNRMTLNRW